MSRGWLAFVAVALSTACATSPPAGQGNDADARAPTETPEAFRANATPVVVEPQRRTGDTVVCREEARVGTHLKRRRCFTRRGLDAMREDAQRWVRTNGQEGALRATR